MRGNKRRVAAVVTAANTPAVNDAILDVVNRKGMRCCVECGATSTPQWREGPMGPKTLCNACGVRRQRLLRKQQAATVGSVPTAPVAAVQARRRNMGRSAMQASRADSEETPFGVVSGSEHSSDETEVDWAAATPTKRHQPPKKAPLRSGAEVEESCNEDESAAYDLLFFAGVECGSGAGSESGLGSQPRPHHHPQDHHYPHHHQQQQYSSLETRRFSGVGVGQEYGSDHQYPHGHNTRRHAQPVRRSDDFYYYCEAEGLGVEGGVNEEAVGGGGGGGGAESGCKRRRLTAPPPPSHAAVLLTHTRPWLAGSSLSSTATEDVAESALAATKLEKDSERSKQQEQQQQPQSAADPLGAAGLDSLPPSVTTPLGSSPPMPSSSAATPPGATTAAAAAEAAAAYSPLASLFTLPMMPLPVLPLSLPVPSLPAMSAEQYQALAKLSLDFQRACLHMYHANVACEAIGSVVSERREAATSAHQHAVAASQQLATEARAVAERYGLRDVLSELHSATAGGKSGAGGRGAAPGSVPSPADGRAAIPSGDSAGVVKHEEQGIPPLDLEEK